MLRSNKLKHRGNVDYDGPTPVPDTTDLGALRAAAAKCRACPLHRNATQTVFGEGAPELGVVFVGEQPGDQEDIAGKPFIGPAGGILDCALHEIGIERSKSYVTNAVKHFKWEPRGKRRIHQKPSSREIEACRPWLNAEIRSLEPQFLVCLGATAVRSVFGKDVPVLKNRGRWMPSLFSPKTLITIHPSSILRAPDAAARERAYADFVADLRVVAKALGKAK
jgi:uracil-DNA glycosylase